MSQAEKRRATPVGRRARRVPDDVSPRERIAAARARVTADRKRGVTTEQWIVDLAATGR